MEYPKYLQDLIAAWHNRAADATDSINTDNDFSVQTRARMSGEAEALRGCAEDLAAALAVEYGEDDDQDPVLAELGVMAECLVILSRLPADGQQRALSWLRSRIQDDLMQAAKAEFKRRQAAEQAASETQ